MAYTGTFNLRFLNIFLYFLYPFLFSETVPVLLALLLLPPDADPCRPVPRAAGGGRGRPNPRREAAVAAVAAAAVVGADGSEGGAGGRHRRARHSAAGDCRAAGKAYT